MAQEAEEKVVEKEVLPTKEEEGSREEHEPSETEQKAMSQGWVPKDQWDDSKGPWRSAEQFVDRGELFDKINSLKTEIYNIKRDYNLLADHHRKVSETEYKRAFENLKQERSKAAEEGDTAAVVKYSDQIDELKEQQRQDAPKQVSQSVLTTQMQEWVSKNAWYNNDPELRTAADSLGGGYAQANPGVPFEKVLEYVTERVTKLYPEKFPSKRAKPNGAALVEGTTNHPNPSVSGSRSKGKLSEADLSQDERKVMDTLIKRKVFGNIPESDAKKRYLDDLAKVREA
ncbi:MAG: hypothetical protein WDZ61_00340 [Parcubacteria group bacterium]